MARRYIGTELLNLRGRLGLSQMRLAERLGVHWRSIQEWEKERTAVDTYKADAILQRMKKMASTKGGTQ